MAKSTGKEKPKWKFTQKDGLASQQWDRLNTILRRMRIERPADVATVRKEFEEKHRTVVLDDYLIEALRGMRLLPRD